MRDLCRVKFTGTGRDGKFRNQLRSYVYISRDDSLSSVMVLRRGVFSLFLPLNYVLQHRLIQETLARLLDPHISLGKSLGLCDREFRPESGAFHWALK